MKFGKIVILVSTVALTLTTTTFADQTKDDLQSSQIKNLKAPTMRTLSPRALVSSNARLALLCQANDDCIGKNVANITMPDIGINCIKPSFAARLGNLQNIVPAVSAEWGTSAEDASDELLVYYKRSASDCPAGTIEVMTYDGNHGSPILSDGVSFTLIVP